MTFEVGSAPWGCIDGALYQQSLQLLMRLLDYVDMHNAAVKSGISASWIQVRHSQ